MRKFTLSKLSVVIAIITFPVLLFASVWEITTVDSYGAVGETTSLALDTTNNPHISYYDLSNIDLKYAYSRVCPNDFDCDGIFDNDDICLDDVNPNQEDADGDGVGDACDLPQPGCTSDVFCSDGRFCNGIERCVGGYCQAGSTPCPDDGLFCNGEESCDEENDRCLHSGDPCTSPEICNEADDVCEEASPPSCTTDADCDDTLFCNGAERCEEGACEPGTDPCQEGEECDEENDVCKPPPVPCALGIAPETAEVVSGQTVSFTVIPEGECSNPDYEWSVTSAIGSVIDEGGNYVAGRNNDFSHEVIDTVKVVDNSNGGIQAEAMVTIFACPLVQLYGEGSGEVAFFRAFRDTILSHSSGGQEIIRLYYEWSPMIAKRMEEDEEFREEIKELIDGIVPLVR